MPFVRRLRSKLLRGPQAVYPGVPDVPHPAPIYLHNTLAGEKQDFSAGQRSREVKMYNCGPTVYDRQHIGNLSMFVFTDVLRKVIEYNGYAVKQVINITDFGHLTSDADEGEDKMIKGLRREGLEPTLENMRSMADRYTEIFKQDIASLNVDITKIEFPRASEHVPGQIAMIQTLEDKSYAYETSDGVYYDTAQFPSYGALGNIRLDTLKEGARVEANPEKHSPADFVMWKKSDGLGWESPWGCGFPGWHIECSAMIRRCLGEQIDIHTGGIEHIAIHHNNEIAQSEAATGKKPLSRFWLHRNHLQFDGGKIAKSTGNVVYLSDIAERGYHPFALRYLLLGASYRTPMNFTWEALDAAQTAFLRLRKIADAAAGTGTVPESYRVRWHERFNDDVDTAGALAVVWEMTRDTSLSPADMRAGILDADRVFGLGMAAPDETAQKLSGTKRSVSDLPEDIQRIIMDREEARSNKEWARADTLRQELAQHGYDIKDTASGIEVVER